MAKRYLTLVACLGGMAVCAGCREKVDDAAQIQRRIRAAANAATERDVPGVLEWVAPEFRGRVGIGWGDEESATVDKRQLSFLLMRFLRRGPAPTVLVRSVDVEVEGDAATAVVLALVSQRAGAPGPRARAQAARGDLLRLDCALERKDGEWWVVKADRSSADTKDFLLGE